MRRPDLEPAARRRAHQADRRPAASGGRRRRRERRRRPTRAWPQLAGVGPEAAKDFGADAHPARRRALRRDHHVRADRRRRRPVLSLPAREDRRLPRRAEAAGAVPRRAPCGCRAAPGAFALYQFDRREVLRYTTRDRLAAYRRVLGYGSAPGAGRARAPTPTSTSCSRISSTR